jgi:hypothetical protein
MDTIDKLVFQFEDIHIAGNVESDPAGLVKKAKELFKTTRDELSDTRTKEREGLTMWSQAMAAKREELNEESDGPSTEEETYSDISSGEGESEGAVSIEL